jgi:DNA-binding NarL/FixJ family response regulator
METLCILVVDDNARFRQNFARLLDLQPDMEVVAQAGSLAEARGLLEGIDVAIIDRKLPDGDGHELIDEAHRASPGAVVLEMSATVEQDFELEALTAGAEGIVDKMAPPEEIAARIRAVVSG